MDKTRRSKLAEDIVNNPVWGELFDDVKHDLFDQFCAKTDIETRERIAMALDMMEDLKIKLEAKIMDGVKLNIVGDNNG